MPFPLSFIPHLSYKTGGRKFGAPRDGGARKHAACDLIAPEGAEILAIEDGVVAERVRGFYRGTSQLVVRHASGVVRYCEIKSDDSTLASIHPGKFVKAGEVIAHVGKMYRDSMLHFELYKGTKAGPLTVKSGSGFQRRSDLTDPAPLLDRLAADLQMSAATQMIQAITARTPGVRS